MNSQEPGAPAGRGFVPLSVPHLAGNEWAYVKECLDTNWVSSAGPFVDRFERELAAAAGARFAVATVNGTAALHIALLLAGVHPGDEVVVSDLTFIAPANAVRYAGAYPVFVDAEEDYWQMDVQKLCDFLEQGCDVGDAGLRNRATGRRVSAILPVHILGGVCDMEPILDVASRFSLPVVEDATECLGARYRGRPAGSLGLIGCFSFNGNKILTTGGGGMLVTNDEGLARRARYLTTQAKDDPVEFVHRAVGYNYRLPNVLAAIGCAQLEHLDSYVLRKREIAAAYDADFRTVPGLHSTHERPGDLSTFWLYTVRLEAEAGQRGSRELLGHLEAASIQARPLWQPMHLSPAHRGAFATDCSVAELLNRQCLSLPCSVGLGDAERERVASVVLQTLGLEGCERQL
jgi:perosamine synthetase